MRISLTIFNTLYFGLRVLRQSELDRRLFFFLFYGKRKQGLKINVSHMAKQILQLLVCYISQ